ncbi:MAG: DUF1499 domain-containing protein [Bdellovibrionales bacterium]|nr:DUF1499 domain-containing protein [Ramlibacter sp.]
MKTKFAALALAVLLGACAAPFPQPSAQGAPGLTSQANEALSCALPSNCVNSLGTDGLAPLLYSGTTASALDLLQATLATFPEATVVRTGPLALELIFTTPAGFRDQVDFRIDEQARRIDFRSRSLLGVFDFGKNRSRMQEFSTRFAARSRR